MEKVGWGSCQLTCDKPLMAKLIHMGDTKAWRQRTFWNQWNTVFWLCSPREFWSYKANLQSWSSQKIYPLLDPETLKCQSYLLANFWVFLLLPQTAARLCSFSTSLANHEKRVYFHSWQVRIAYFLTEYVVKFCVTATNKHLPLLLWAAVLPELCTNGIKRRPISSPLSMEGAADCRSCLSWGGTCISWISFWESEVCKESLTSPNWRGSGNGLLFSEQSVFG